MSHPRAKVHRMFELVEPIAAVSFSQVALEAFLAHGMRNIWDGYFAGRAAPLGQVSAAVVHAAFYNFAEGEVARHIPWVWGKISPQDAIALRERASVAVLRQRLGDLAVPDGLARLADLTIRAAISAPIEGRVLYAGLRELEVPEEPLARLWHASTLLREHRGDGHNTALLAHGIGGIEAHVLMALFLGGSAAEFGRIHHLPKRQLDTVVNGLRDRGLVDNHGQFTEAGRELREQVESMTDDLAAPPYDVLTTAELDQLISGLQPIAARASG